MTLRIKPNYQRVWAELGDNTKPVDSYIQNGWLAVKPPRQYMNWIQNRQDSMLAYLNQTGVSQWDVNTDYHGGSGTATCSYVQGSDGKVYKCLADNGPSVTGATSKDPVNQPANAAFWVVAFADKSVVDSLSATVATHTTQIGNGSGVTNAAAWRSKLSALAASDFTGANQDIVGTDGFQKLPGGLIMQWGLAPASLVGNAATNTVTFNLPIAFPNACLSAQASFTTVEGGCATGTTNYTTTTIDVPYANLSGSIKNLQARVFAIGY